MLSAFWDDISEKRIVTLRFIRSCCSQALGTVCFCGTRLREDDDDYHHYHYYSQQDEDEDDDYGEEE